MDNEISLKLPGSHIKHLKDFYAFRLGELQRELQEIQALINELDRKATQQEPLSAASGYQNNGTTNGSVDKETRKVIVYNPGWPQTRKATHVIKQCERALTTSEITDYIIENYEPEIDRKKFLGSLSSVLGANAKEGGTFSRRKNDLNDWVYDTINKEQQ